MVPEEASSQNVDVIISSGETDVDDNDSENDTGNDVDIVVVEPVPVIVAPDTSALQTLIMEQGTNLRCEIVAGDSALSERLSAVESGLASVSWLLAESLAASAVSEESTDDIGLALPEPVTPDEEIAPESGHFLTRRWGAKKKPKKVGG